MSLNIHINLHIEAKEKRFFFEQQQREIFH